MGNSFLALKILGLAASALLPFISAVKIKGTGRSYLRTFLRCLIAYIVIIVGVTSGYIFQGLATNMWWPGKFFSGTLWIKFFLGQSFHEHSIPIVVIEACVIAFVALLPSSEHQRAIRCGRSAFAVFSIGDICALTVAGVGVPEHLICLGFNLVGAVVCGAFSTVVANGFLPALDDTRINDGQQVDFVERLDLPL